MNRAGAFETIIGLVVIAVAVAFLYFAVGVSDKRVGGGDYKVDAVFASVNGIAVGSQVKIAGVQIGSVTSNKLDPDTYEALLQLTLNQEVPVPEDSVAKIVSDGFLGGAHVAIEPGASEDYLREGDKITITRGSVDLLNLAVQAFTSQSRGGSSGSSTDSENTQKELDPLGDF